MSIAILEESLDSMVGRPGHARAYNAYFAVHGGLPEEKFSGEHYEVLDLDDIEEDVGHWIKSNCSR